MRRTTVAIALLGMIATFLMPSTAGADPQSDCLARSAIIVVSGTRSTQYRSGPGIPSNSTVDARSATWAIPVPTAPNQHDYPVYFRGDDGSNICLVGGHVTQLHDHLTTPWLTWKNGAGLTVKEADFSVVGTTLFNVGDGFRFGGSGADNWSIDGARATQVHDDCLENDGFNSGSIDDTYFDGCYVFYSSRQDSPSSNSGAAQTVSITDSLVRMQAMPFDDGGNPGHGAIWKMGNGVSYGGPARTGRAPALAVRDTIIRVDQRPSQGGKLGLPLFDADQNGSLESSYLSPANCSNNTLVLAGTATLTAAEQASYTASGCFTILTGQAGLNAWNAAVATWEAAH